MKKSIIALAVLSLCSSLALAKDITLTESGTYTTADHYIVQQGSTLDGKEGSLIFNNPNSTSQRLTVNGNIQNLKDLKVEAGGFTNNGEISMSGELFFGSINAGPTVTNNGTIKAGSLKTVWSAGFNNTEGAVLDVQSGLFDVANTIQNDGTIIIHEKNATFKKSVVFGKNGTIKTHDDQLASITAEGEFTNNATKLAVHDLLTSGASTRNNGELIVNGNFSANNYYSNDQSKLTVKGTATIGYITEKAFGSLTADKLHITSSAVSQLHTIVANTLEVSSTASLNNLKKVEIGTFNLTGGYCAFSTQKDLTPEENIVKINQAVFTSSNTPDREKSGIQLFNTNLELGELVIDMTGPKGMIQFYEGQDLTAHVGKLTVKSGSSFFPTAKDTNNTVIIDQANFANDSSISGDILKPVSVKYGEVTAEGNLKIQVAHQDANLEIGLLNVKGGDVTSEQKLQGTQSNIVIDEGGTLDLQKGTNVDEFNVHLNTLEEDVLKVATVGDNTKGKFVVDQSLNTESADVLTQKLANATQFGANDQTAYDYVIEEGDIYGAIVGNSKTGYQQKDNTKLEAMSSLNVMAAVAWRHDNDTLFKRMGELRDLQGSIGTWARLYGSEQEYGAESVKAKNTTIQVGADYDVGAGWKVGGAFAYTDSSSTFDIGNGDNKMYSVAAYGTWLGENGQFVDVIGKYSRLSNEFTAKNMKGDFDNNALSLGVESGWHFTLNDLAFVEPSVGLTYGRIFGDDFTTSNDVRVEQKDFESLVARLGVRSGFYFPQKKGNIYARVAVLHDFMGEVESSVAKATDLNQRTLVSDDLGDTWVEYGIGANFNLSKSCYTYVDLEKTADAAVKEAWKWTIGARYVF